MFAGIDDAARLICEIIPNFSSAGQTLADGNKEFSSGRSFVGLTCTKKIFIFHNQQPGYFFMDRFHFYVFTDIWAIESACNYLTLSLLTNSGFSITYKCGSLNPCFNIDIFEFRVEIITDITCISYKLVILLFGIYIHFI